MVPINKKKTDEEELRLNQLGKQLKPLFTNKEASEYLHVSELTLWRWRRKGQLSFLRLGGRVMYTAEDLNSLIDSVRS